MSDDEEFLSEEKAPEVIDTKAHDVPEKKVAREPEAVPPVDDYVIPEDMKPLVDLLVTETDLMTKRAKTLEALAKQGKLPNQFAFDVVDEAIIAAYIRRVADFFEIPPEAIISSMELANAKVVERQLAEATAHDDGSDEEDEYAFGSYR